MNKQIRWTAATVLSLFSPVLFALGLGGATVDSYLGQPLDVRVDLISQSSEELQTITAGLASAKAKAKSFVSCAVGRFSDTPSD